MFNYMIKLFLRLCEIGNLTILLAISFDTFKLKFFKISPKNMTMKR